MAATDLKLSFDGKDPAAFYLGALQHELEATANVCLVVEGTRLPVHSHVLQCNSRVLCAMFADLTAQAGMCGQLGSGGSRKRKRADQQGGQLVLEEPLRGFSLHDVALFLRLVYNQEWREGVAATLGALHDSLPALLRLAHRLDAPGLQGTLTKYMADTTLTTSAQLSLWLKAAADCQLEELRLRLLARLAGRLAKKERLPNIMALLTDLQGLDSRTLSQLVAILAAAGEPPTSDSLASAVDKAAGFGSAEWMLTQFSQQPRGPNQCVYSPWFDLQGHQWRLSVFPGGEDGTPKHLALYLECGTPGVRAEYELAILDETLGVQEVATDTDTFETDWGYPRFIRLSALRRRGLLAGDCLRLRVTVTVLPSLPDPAPTPLAEAIGS